MNQLVILGTAIMFLTRLPVGKFASGDSQVLVQAVRYFPLVGALVALIMGSVLLLSSLVLPLSVAVMLTLVSGVLATGAFHEDGLADLADSAGAFDVSRKLEIMHDSRVGTYGALGLILCVALRFALILELSILSIATATGALVLAHAISRWSSVYMMANIDYARLDTANKVVAQGVDNHVFMHATVCLLLVMIFPAALISPWVYPVVMAAWIVTIACACYFKSTFNGITGDCLGAANVIVELFCLSLVLAGLQRLA